MAAKPQLEPVKSTWIKGFHYDPKTRHLDMHLKDGKVLPHDDVPIEKVEAMRGASSVGGFYNMRIRDNHPAAGR